MSGTKSFAKKVPFSVKLFGFKYVLYMAKGRKSLVHLLVQILNKENNYFQGTGLPRVCLLRTLIISKLIKRKLDG